jgi:hypothetical protein
VKTIIAMVYNLEFEDCTQDLVKRGWVAGVLEFLGISEF